MYQHLLSQKNSSSSFLLNVQYLQLLNFHVLSNIKKLKELSDTDLSSSPAASSSSSVEDSALSSASSLVIANLRPMEDLQSIILWSSQIII